TGEDPASHFVSFYVRQRIELRNALIPSERLGRSRSGSEPVPQAFSNGVFDAPVRVVKVDERDGNDSTQRRITPKRAGLLRVRCRKRCVAGEYRRRYLQKRSIRERSLYDGVSRILSIDEEHPIGE